MTVFFDSTIDSKMEIYFELVEGPFWSKWTDRDSLFQKVWLSVIRLVQNVFHQGKFMRTISLNTRYMVLFKNPKDSGHMCHLSAQLFPGDTKFLGCAYAQATLQSHGYLLLTVLSPLDLTT